MPPSIHKFFSLQRLTDLLAILFMLGIMFSKFLLSLSMIAICALAIYIFTKEKNINKHASLLPYLILCLVFFAVLISGINSEDTTVWLDYLRKKLPFLVLPPAFFLLRDLTGKSYYKYLIFWMAICFFSVIIVLINYLILYEEFHMAISQGQSIPTPVDHIKYSIFLAFGSVAAFILFIKRNFLFVPTERYFYLFASLTLFIALHVLAVRSGIALLYITIFILGTAYLISQKKYLVLGFFLISIFLLPYLAYRSLPSFHRKVSYMLYDLEKYRSESGGLFYSDSERIYSYRAGWELFMENPFMGTGIGDLKVEMSNVYRDKLGLELDKFPHNQYLFTLAGMGIIGFLLLLPAILIPVFYFGNKSETVFLAFNIIILFSFLVENTLERSYSTGFYLFFLLCGLNYMNRK